MDISLLAAAGAFVALLALAWGARRRSRSGLSPKQPPRRIGSIGPGAAGTFYEFLNEDKRKAIEIVLEERAGYADPETRDGDQPQFEVRGLPPKRQSR